MAAAARSVRSRSVDRPNSRVAVTTRAILTRPVSSDSGFHGRTRRTRSYGRMQRTMRASRYPAVVLQPGRPAFCRKHVQKPVREDDRGSREMILACEHLHLGPQVRIMLLPETIREVGRQARHVHVRGQIRVVA